MSVGRSWRTFAKHELMRSFLGQEVGAAGNIGAVWRHVWIDLTAGDAAPIDGEAWHEASSPGILAHHATKARKPVAILLHEIQPSTYDRLVTNMDARLPAMGYEKTGEGRWKFGSRVTITAVNASGHEAAIDFIGIHDAVLAFNDPNAITEWAMRDTFASEIARRTPWFRSLSTLGCNPAGLKRIGLEERQLWFVSTESQESASPAYRDLLLAVIERDEAQWAYLLSTATKWQAKTEKVVQTAFRKTGRTVLMAWRHRDHAAYEEAKRTLFLTKAERKAASNPMLPLDNSDAA